MTASCFLERWGKMSGYLTVSSEAVAEYVEKRSKFIGYTFPCKTEAEAMEYLEAIRTKHWDARHHCFAFVAQEGRISRFSDDGEPHGTAGKPILEVINGAGVVNTLIVVVRYFGGVLLGTGGLVRAYSKSAKESLLNAGIVKMLPCTEFSVICDYTDHGKLQKLLEQGNANITDTQFTDKVKLLFVLRDSDTEALKLKLTEAFSARLQMTEERKIIAPFNVEN